MNDSMLRPRDARVREPRWSQIEARPSLGEAVALYLDYQRRRGRQPETLRHARAMLRPFCAWAGDDVLPAEVTLAAVELDFMAAWERGFVIRNGRLPSIATVRSVRGALKGLYAFLDRFDLLWHGDGTRARNPLRHLEVPAAAAPGCRALTPERAAALVAAARTPRQKIVLNLLRWTGVRAGEAAALSDEDVDLERREVRVRVSKTPRGRRTVPLLPGLEEPVREWRDYCDAHGLRRPGGPFLVTRHGTAMHTRYVWRVVREVSARAGITTPGGHHVTPHTLRRTLATELLNRGVRLEVVSRLLGHASTTITEQAYAVLGDQRIRSEIAAAFAGTPSPDPTTAHLLTAASYGHQGDAAVALERLLDAAVHLASAAGVTAAVSR